MKTMSQNNPGCCCSGVVSQTKKVNKFELVKSTFLAVVIAFFPKCPLCWAAYMSLFSSIGISRIPYMPWLFPILIMALGIHLFFLFRKIHEKGYLPIALCIIGALCIVLSRYYLLENPLTNYVGLLAIISGSLLNNFSLFKIQIFNK